MFVEDYMLMTATWVVLPWDNENVGSITNMVTIIAALDLNGKVHAVILCVPTFLSTFLMLLLVSIKDIKRYNSH